MDGYTNGYHEDSDADDEYDPGAPSPGLPPDYPSSPTESDMHHSNQQTPTYRRDGFDMTSPGVPIDAWNVEQCADFIVNLGLEEYADAFVENNVSGDALVALMHDDLKEMGISIMGHRLTILKSVYDAKVKQNVTIEPEHYVPPSADANSPDARVTQDDVVRIINQIKLRDERLLAAEEELRILKEDLNRIVEEAKRLREDVLPVIRVAKDKSQPLPTPEGVAYNDPLPSPQGSAHTSEPKQPPTGVVRKPSTKLFPINRDPKLPSPTIHEPTSLDPTPAAKAAISQLGASMTSSQGSQNSPRFSSQPSPTSPPYASQPPRLFPRHESRPPSSRFATPASGSTTTLVQPSNSSIRTATTPYSTSTPQLGSEEPASNASNGGSYGGGSGTMEFMKSFRVSMDEPCHKVLPVALKKYHIQDDWRQYSLYIVHGDQERCLGLEERPLILFKQLASEGKKPMFMLRKHAAPAVGFDHTRGAPADSPASLGPPSAPGSAGIIPQGPSSAGNGTASSSTPGASLVSGGSSVRVQSYADPMQLPGGVF